MKNIKILTIVLLAIGLASAGIGCGSSSGGSSGSQVSSGVNALPPANLTVQNVGSAAGQAVQGADKTPPSDVSTITSSTVSSSTSGNIPTLSLLLKGLGGSVVVKPQSAKGATVNALSLFQQATTSGTCAPSSMSATSGSGAVNVSVTWNNVSCTFSTETMTINGTIGVTGTYDTSLGNIDLTETMNIQFTLNDPSYGYNESVSLNGTDSITGAGVIAGTTSITYSDKGHTAISATYSGTSGSYTITGWIDVDDTFTGTPSQIIYGFADGTETDSGSTKIGTYGTGTITMTTSGIPATSVTVNGSGLFGVSVSSGTSKYSGKVNVTYDNIVFNSSVCTGYPSSGTMTVAGKNTFVFTFDGQTCGCAAVTENGTPTPNSPLCYF